MQPPGSTDKQPTGRWIRPWLTHTAAAAVGLLIGALAASAGHPAPGEGASPSATVAPTPAQTAVPPSPATTAPSEKAGPAEAEQIPGDGVFLVGRDIKPGTYRSEGPQGEPIIYCAWARLSGTGGEGKDIISGDASKGAETVTIAATDKAFRTSGCKTWKKTN